jgi:serine/threonine-protein kinase
MPSEDEQLLTRARTRLGTVLKGKYHLDRVLGAGGMAVVYAATHRNGKEFAVKVLHSELSLHTEVRSRFLREGYVANKVKHPDAVAILDDDVAEDGSAFLVMDLLEGRTLEDLWEAKGHKLPLDLVLYVGRKLLDVLTAAHAHGIVHRDIKPANLFLTTMGQVRVLDFGIARFRDVASTHATQTGMMMGTPAFMAPEQAAGLTNDVDALTDVWAASATMFTLSSGLLVHDGDNAQQIMLKAATKPARSLGEVLPGAPSEVVAVIDRGLSFEKANRWPSAAQMSTALADAMAKAFPTASLSVPPVLPSARPSASLGGSASSGSPISVPRRALITAQPVTSDGAGLTGHRLRSNVALLAVGGAIVAILGGVLLLRGHSELHSDGPPSTAASAPPLNSSVGPTPPIPGQATEPQVSLAPIEPAPSVAPNKHPPAPVLGPASTTPRAAPPAAPAARSTATKVSDAPPATPRPATCSPPYIIDPATGVKRWKEECL